jgi:7,8-dihydroneopterin aldolase/epimerase/oxygenase
VTIGDSLTLTGLRVRAHHGVYDFERENGQDFLIDLTIGMDLGRAAESDDVRTTIHYGELAERVAAAVASDPVDLIETVAERVAAIALSYPAADSVRVTVHKPDAPIPVPFDDVAVTIVRSAASRPAGFTPTGDDRS